MEAAKEADTLKGLPLNLKKNFQTCLDKLAAEMPLLETS